MSVDIYESWTVFFYMANCKQDANEWLNEKLPAKDEKR